MLKQYVKGRKRREEKRYLALGNEWMGRDVEHGL
jgi:hypothetical protein